MLMTIIISLIKMHTNFELFTNSWSFADNFYGNYATSSAYFTTDDKP